MATRARNVSPSTTARNNNVMTIRRTGEFVVGHTGDNKNQCGPLGTNILHYFVAIVSKPTRLNSKGFIIDNADVQKYFDNTYKMVQTFVSCENIAERACEDFLQMFGTASKNATKVYGICVVVSGLPGHAELECQWLRPGYEYDNRIIMGMRPTLSL